MACLYGYRRREDDKHRIEIDPEAAEDDGVWDAVSTMKKYSGETELSREIVEAFIDKVLIYDPEHIEIRWKFPDEVIKFIES